MEKWIGDCIGKMHIHRISQEQLARELGIRRDYLCKILNGKEKPNGARERIVQAIDRLLKEDGKTS